MLNRKIYSEIERFYSEHKNMALMVTGARQVGKSFIIEEYAKSAFESYIRIDFIENPEYTELFNGSGNAEEQCSGYPLSLETSSFPAAPLYSSMKCRSALSS